MKKKSNPDAIILCGIVLLIAAIIMAVVGLQSPAELKNVSEITAAEMSDEYSYYFEELTVIDLYMTQTGGESGNGKYYLAAFEGEDERLYFLSIYAENKADIHDSLEEYASNPDLQIGDLILEGCFSTETVDSVEDLTLYYERGVIGYDSMFEDELDMEVVDLSLHLTYVCKDPADYDSEASHSSMLIVGAVFLVLGAVLLFFGIKSKKAQKAEAEARARFNENQPQDETENP